jgi:hypothetical protein
MTCFACSVLSVLSVLSERVDCFLAKAPRGVRRPLDTRVLLLLPELAAAYAAGADGAEAEAAADDDSAGCGFNQLKKVYSNRVFSGIDDTHFFVDKTIFYLV